MQVNAKLRHLHISPRKVRLVVDLIRGLSVDAAMKQLTFCRKSASEPVMKLLKSAVANAEHNFQADISTLRIAKIAVDSGSTLHRWRARAHGSAAPIRKRMSHILLILSDESPAEVHRKQSKGGKIKKEEGSPAEKVSETKKVAKKSTQKTKETKKTVSKTN